MSPCAVHACCTRFGCSIPIDAIPSPVVGSPKDWKLAERSSVEEVRRMPGTAVSAVSAALKGRRVGSFPSWSAL
jgi:hypothetical protein